MSISQHAQRILAAWSVADPEKFETELESALDCCQKSPGNNILEIEQQELLESVILRLRADRQSGLHRQGRVAADRKSSAYGLSAGFSLLQHLSHRATA